LVVKIRVVSCARSDRPREIASTRLEKSHDACVKFDSTVGSCASALPRNHSTHLSRRPRSRAARLDA
jgi:hypothetical protein